MGDIGDFIKWASGRKDKGRPFWWLLVILILGLFTITVYRITTGKHFRVWEFEWNKPQPEKIVEHDTITIKVPETAKAPTVIKQQVTGPVTTKDTKNQVVGNNYGSVGDNNYTLSEKILTDKDKTDVVQVLKFVKEKYGIASKYVQIDVTPNSNGSKYTLQLKDYLKSLGYKIVSENGIVYREDILKGVEFGEGKYFIRDINDNVLETIKCYRIVVGTFD